MTAVKLVQPAPPVQSSPVLPPNPVFTIFPPPFPPASDARRFPRTQSDGQTLIGNESIWRDDDDDAI